MGGVKKPDEIDVLRGEIDALDDRILDLLNQRARRVVRVGEVKAARKTEFYVPSREREIFERLDASNAGPFPSSAMRNVFREILSGCLSLEKPLRVAYLGPEASFTHMACKKHFGLSALCLPAKSISNVFDDVARGRSELGVVPIENSTEGVVNHTLDMFMESDLGICAEVLLEVNHHLLSKAANLAAVRKIYSHPQALAQCRTWLDANLPGIAVIDVASTALAAQVAAEDETAAAIASELAAQLYDLRVLKSRIEDAAANYTRFLVIGRRKVKPSPHDKTSLMFCLKDEPGILYRALKPFDDHKINLTKIESRPSKKKAWEYIFFTDLDGHAENANVAAALEELRASCVFLKVLGSYPRGRLG
jgi:chorismate mutase/prephenate dehydratase